MNEIALPGLDGSSLLGFVAGLGVLEALWSTRRIDQPEPRLRWIQKGTWQPVVTGASTLEEVADRILQDSVSDLVQKVLAFRYIKLKKRGPKEVKALAAPAGVYRAAVMSHLLAGRWPAADWLGALMCESAAETKGDDESVPLEELAKAGIEYDPDVADDRRVNPTPFDFTSRNTQFLDQIRRIRDTLRKEAIIADIGLGEGSPVDRIMRWDSLVDMPGALFDRFAPTQRPTAEWLLFRGITFFALSADGGNARMAGLSGRRKTGELSWVLWDGRLTRDVVKTTVGVRWRKIGASERLARGAIAAFTVSLRKDATGYDGAVSPSRPLKAVGSARARGL